MISMDVAGINTYRDLGLVMTVEEMNPPEVKEYKVDVPGGNGCINLTSALSGDTAYNNRSMTFVFTMVNTTDDFERAKTKLSNLLHGREHDFKLSFDEEYTYHGWFSVSKYKREGNKKQITVKVDADPYKTKGLQTIATNTAGGKIIMVQSGRKPVRPTIETDGSIKVICNGVETEFPAGSWKPYGLILKEGANELYLRAMEFEPTVSWSYLSERTWGELSHRRWFEWMNASDSDEEISPKTWGDLKTMTWGELSDYRWSDVFTLHERETEEAIVYLQYEWSDL